MFADIFGDILDIASVSKAQEKDVVVNKDKHIDAYNMISRSLLKNFVSSSKKNVVFSPYSIVVLLGILADATDSDTRMEILDSLGENEYTDFIKWLKRIQKEISADKAIVSSNAVCVRKDKADKIVSGYEKHLQDLFGGKLFVTENIERAVNEWVNNNTNGMIPKIVDKLDPETLVSLMNALCFEARWQDKYSDHDISIADFHNCDGSTNEVSMMHSIENYYTEDDNYIGVVKPYKNSGFSFMALLPKEKDKKLGTCCLEKMDFARLFLGKVSMTVKTMIPEFKYDFSDELTDYCQGIGIKKAFSEDADFSPMIDEWIKIDKVIHKAFIQVDRNGTKSAAATVATGGAGGIGPIIEKEVILDRPFLYAIVHNDLGLPIFIGAVNQLADEEYLYNSKTRSFESEEERHEAAKSLYRSIAYKVHPDINPMYESVDELRDIFEEAQIAYRKYDVGSLENIERNLQILLKELGI